MKKVAITMMMCLAALCTAMAQSPMTPRAAMANCEMVNPQAHIANDYKTPEAFTKHNKTLDLRVEKWAAEQTKNIDMNFDPVKAQKQTEQKQKEMMQRMQQIDPQKQMEAIQRMMADMKAYYKLSDKDMEKLMNMSDKQGEAFIINRAKTLGVEVKNFDPAQYGMVVFEQDEREMALAEKRVQVQKRIDELEKTVQAYQNRVDVVLKNISSLEKSAAEKCKAEVDKWYKEYENIPTAAGPGGVKNPETVEKLRSKATNALILFEQNHWIAPAREQLIGLLDYAEAADEANAECLRLSLSVTKDAAARQGLMQKYNHVGIRYAVYVWGLYNRTTTEYCKFIPKRGWDH